MKAWILFRQTAVPALSGTSSTDGRLAAKKKNWIDFDAGRLLSGSPREELTRELADLVLAVASGRQRAKTESFDKSEITIFRDGVTL